MLSSKEVIFVVVVIWKLIRKEVQMVKVVIKKVDLIVIFTVICMLVVIGVIMVEMVGG